jgi:hypothetical protein
MSEDPPFTPVELGVVLKAKRSLTILAKIIRDKDPKEVMKDPDIVALINKRVKDKLDANPNLKEDDARKEVTEQMPNDPAFRERLTPDLPQLNVEQEALVVGRLGSSVFSELLRIQQEEKNNNNGPD